MVTAPQTRNDFKVAIICALPLEAEMVELVLDVDWSHENRMYGKAPRDPNAYTTGVIGKHNVVLAYMPGMGSNSAATVAAGLRSSFPNIEIAFVVGICGVMPENPQTNEEIILGDCVISTTVVQYDFGREYPSGFKRKKNIEDSIGRANPEIRSYTSKLTTRRNRKHLVQRLAYHLSLIQGEEPDLKRPANEKDRLFRSDYRHKHHVSAETCNKCLLDLDTCTKDCDALECEDRYLLQRVRLAAINDDSQLPKIHFGRFGTANTVMKSGEKRDQINAEDDIIAFEMEGSGVWDTLPTIIVKSACDYADNHKSKEWQPYAAASAAAGLKAVLEQWEAPEQMFATEMGNLSLNETTIPNPTTSLAPPLPPRSTAAGRVSPSPQNTSTQLHGTSNISGRPASNPFVSIGNQLPTAQPSQQGAISSFFIPPAPSEEDQAASNQELIYACRDGRLDLIESILRHGANINASSEERGAESPLIAAVSQWKFNLDFSRNPLYSFNLRHYNERIAQYFKIINYLLNHGASWDDLPVGDMQNELRRALVDQAKQNEARQRRS